MGGFKGLPLQHTLALQRSAARRVSATQRRRPRRDPSGTKGPTWPQAKPNMAADGARHGRQLVQHHSCLSTHESALKRMHTVRPVSFRLELCTNSSGKTLRQYGLPDAYSVYSTG